ncbi:hypothetical protein MUA03_07130 [Enterobacteriaceae bacterium H16N7]|nr:hypothetical protein [Dryocola clanedunensis]
MKARTLAVALLVSFTFIQAAAGADFPRKKWAVHMTNFVGEIADKPAEGFEKVTYPITVISGPAEKHFYYSQFGYFNQGNDGRKGRAYYVGLQPQGNGRARAVFSVFGYGARKIDSSCTSEADGHEGSSCQVLFTEFKFNRAYNLVTELQDRNGSENIWVGYIYDTTTHVRTRIGSWATPADWGYISGKSIGFIEFFTGLTNCNQIPATTAWFGPGIGETGSHQEVMGSLSEAYGVGICKNSFSFSSATDSRGGLLVQQSSGTD